MATVEQLIRRGTKKQKYDYLTETFPGLLSAPGNVHFKPLDVDTKPEDAALNWGIIATRVIPSDVTVLSPFFATYVRAVVLDCNKKSVEKAVVVAKNECWIAKNEADPAREALKRLRKAVFARDLELLPSSDRKEYTVSSPTTKPPAQHYADEMYILVTNGVGALQSLIRTRDVATAKRFSIIIARAMQQGWVTF